MSSSRMAGSSGALAWRMKASQFSPLRASLDSRTAVRSEKLSITAAIPRTANATMGDSSGAGLVILWMPS